MAKKLSMTVKGKKRNVFLGEELSPNSWKARLRAPGTGNSVRGKVVWTNAGLRFFPSNRESLNNL